MSNHLAVAAVTEALRQFIFRSLADFPIGFDVSARKPPAEPPPDPTITIFLYQVTPNAALRNRDAPTRAVDGTLLKTPQAALDLHYLVSFYGDESQLVPQRLLGAVVRSLYEEPVLSLADIEEAERQPALAGADLSAAAQRVRFTPSQMDLDDMSKLWQMLGQTPYGLSVVYQAAAVLLDGRATPAAGLPVLRRQIRVEPFTRPVVTRLLSAGPGGTADDGPVTADRDLVLIGTSLTRPGLDASVGGLAAAVLSAAEDRVVVDQPDELPPGVHPVLLRYTVEFDDPATARPLLESNAVPYVRRPRVLSATHGAGGVTVGLDMPVRVRQRAVLLLDEFGAPASARSYEFPAPFPLGPGDTTVDGFTVPVPGVGAGDFLVRVQVDGAQSTLNVDAAGTITGPTVRVAGGG